MFGSIVNFGMNIAYRRFKKQFDAETQAAGEVNRKLLSDILTENSATEYGVKYDFANIKNADDYRRKVPLTDWDDYAFYIEKIADGEKNVLTKADIVHLANSSGTTGKLKQVPVTKRSQQVVAKNHAFITQGILNEKIPHADSKGRGIFLVSAVQPATTQAGITQGTATSSGIKSMMKMAPILWSSPPAVFYTADSASFMYLHLLFGLQEENLKYITAPFASAVLELFRTLENRWFDLLQDVEKGQLSGDLKITEEARNELQTKLNPNPKLSEKLRPEFEKGLTGIAPRVWRKLRYVSTVVGGSFEVYSPKLKEYLGEVPIYSAVYGASEAQIGVCTEIGKPAYAVTPATAFYEFIPIENAEEERPKTLLIDEITENSLYEIVVTNLAGFYRYRLGDVVKVVGKYNAAPVIEFQYRRGQLLNVASEKTSEKAVITAVMDAMNEANLSLIDFTTAEDYSVKPARYVFYFEVLEENPSLSPDAMEDVIIRATPYYTTIRGIGTIGKPVINFVKHGTFARMRNKMIERGTTLSQVKTPRVVRDLELLEILNSNCKEPEII
jgi:hypothetical protein